MKTRYWIAAFVVLAVVCGVLTVPMLMGQEAAYARISYQGKVVKVVDLAIDQEFTVGGTNTVTVEGGKIAVTWADCPDHYCVDRGFCSGGADIVCLPNRLVITFLGEQQTDGVSG